MRCHSCKATPQSTYFTSFNCKFAYANIAASWSPRCLQRKLDSRLRHALPQEKAMLPPDRASKKCNTLYLAGKACEKRSTNKMLVLLLLFFRKVLPPACHLERSPPEIPPSLCSVLLRSSTPLRFAQNDTGGRSRNPKGERQRRSDLAGR
jgi:hypothetical protein